MLYQIAQKLSDSQVFNSIALRHACSLLTNLNHPWHHSVHPVYITAKTTRLKWPPVKVTAVSGLIEQVLCPHSKWFTSHLTYKCLPHNCGQVWRKKIFPYSITSELHDRKAWRKFQPLNTTQLNQGHKKKHILELLHHPNQHSTNLTISHFPCIHCPTVWSMTVLLW